MRRFKLISAVAEVGRWKLIEVAESDVHGAVDPDWCLIYSSGQLVLEIITRGNLMGKMPWMMSKHE